jgi:hypothetical protein
VPSQKAVQNELSACAAQMRELQSSFVMHASPSAPAC